MINLKRKTAGGPAQEGAYRARFQEAFFAALSDVISADELAKSILSILSGARQAFNGNAFLFRRYDEYMSLVDFSADKPAEIAGLLKKAGVRAAAEKIPLSQARAKVFKLPFIEYDDMFDLLGDMTTSAACRKIQADLQFNFLASASVRTESADLAILVSLREKPPSLKQDIGRFAFLVKEAYYLSALKERLRELETRFDEQFIRLKNELQQKESAHLSLFNEMTIAAAVMDERGVVIEANEALRILAPVGWNPVGQSFSSLISEDGRRDFIEFVMSVAPGESDTSAAMIGGRHYKAYVVVRKKEDGERGLSVIYLSDDTDEIELQRELGRTIDALRAEKDIAERLASEAKKYSEEIVRGAKIPLVLVSGGTVKYASESAERAFEVVKGQTFIDFLSQNGLGRISDDEVVSEVIDEKNRTLSILRWRIADDQFFAFDDITEFKKLQEELHRLTLESGRLFNSLLPTAMVKGDRITKWNDMFGSLLREFLSSDGSLDGFLRYLGESSIGFKSELRSGGTVMRMCRTTDRKYLNVNAAAVEDVIFIFLEDITEQENIKQQLRATQALLNSILESSPEEPIFVVENGIAHATNVAARNSLSVRLDEPVDPAKILSGIGIVDADDIGELNGNFYRVESVPIGSAYVYRFRLANVEVTQRAEIEKLKRRQEILRELSSAERFEDILKGLNDILKSDGYLDVKVIGTGTLQAAKEVGEVYLMTTASEKIEPSLSLSIGESDMTAVRRGGALSRIEVPDTTFMNVISTGDSALLVQSATAGDTSGFASIAITEAALSSSYVADVGKILKVASSVAVGLFARRSAERKFEETGKVTRAIAGLAGLGEGTFEDISRRSVDMLRQVFGAESVGVYSSEGASMTLLTPNASLPGVLSIPAVRFGSLAPIDQLGSTELKMADGFYFAVRSKSKKLALVFTFVGIPPAQAELDAVSSVSLDILGSKREFEDQARALSKLLNNSEVVSEFITSLLKASTADEVVRILRDALMLRDKNAIVAMQAEEESARPGRPMELSERDEEGLAVYEANFLNVGLGTVAVRCSRDAMSRTFVGLAIDKIRSIYALKLPTIQSEAAALRSRLERAGDEHSKLRETIDRIPASLRSARIAIDNVLSRLPFVQGDEKVMQEIRLHLASAAKEMWTDLDGLSRNQSDLFEAVRVAVIVAIGSTSDPASPRVRSFEFSAMTEYRVDQATFDLLKDLFTNFVMKSGARECEVMMTTTQPSPDEIAEGKGKHLGIKLTGGEGESLRDEPIRESASIQTLIVKLEKMGYSADIRVLGNELTLDICELKMVEVAGERAVSAILVEDDKMLVEEESRNLLQIFTRLRVAGDAVEATKIFETEKFTAAFIDLSLPSINGRELCRQIKQNQPECITVLLTNREGEDKSDGVDYIALRPLDEDTIRTYIHKQS